MPLKVTPKFKLFNCNILIILKTKPNNKKAEELTIYLFNKV